MKKLIACDGVTQVRTYSQRPGVGLIILDFEDGFEGFIIPMSGDVLGMML